jgi:hypothetical protein
MSLCEILAAAGRRDEGATLLAETYAGFSEGFETFDLRRARRLMSS